jgi:hypothetical protein
MGGPLQKHQLIVRLSETPGLTGADLRVAIQIIDHYNREKGYAWPSYARLRKKTGLARSTIEAGVDRLAKIGLFQKAKGYPGQSNRYFLVWSFGLPDASGVPDGIGGGVPKELEEASRPVGPYTTYIPEVSNVGDGSSSPAGAGSPGGVAGGGGAADGNAAAFARFWRAYPKKVRQLEAEEEFARAVAKGVDPRLLVDKAAQYARSVEHLAEQPRWIKLPENWLKDRRWLDDPQPHAPREKADPAAKRAKGKTSRGKGAKKPARKEPMADKGRTGRPARPGAQEGDSAMGTGEPGAAGPPPFPAHSFVFVEGIGYGLVLRGGHKRLTIAFHAPRDGRAAGDRTFGRPWPEMRKASRLDAQTDAEMAEHKAASMPKAVAVPSARGGAHNAMQGAPEGVGKPLTEPGQPDPPRPPFKPGDRVGSARTGGGRVLEVNGDSVRVDFVWGIPDDFAFRRAKWVPREVWSQLKQKGSSEADSDWFTDLGAGV